MAQFYLGKEEIYQNLELVNEELKLMEMHGEILITGGASMCLVFSARSATKDIDAIYEPKTVINDIAAKIAVQKGLPKSWLNDSVKGFMHEKAYEKKMPLRNFSNLKIYSVMPEYLLAMKLMASRMESETDKKDIIFLMKHLKIDTSEKANQVIESFFEDKFILPKTRYVIEECLQEIIEGNEERV
jgi:predicted nucleotidyltransferase